MITRRRRRRGWRRPSRRSARELEKQVARGRLAEGKARFLGSIVTGVDRAPPASRGCDLVIEAVFEEIAVKQRGLRRARGGRLARSACSSRTRRRSPSPRWRPGLEHPERVVGMHFFNPVAVLPLVELVRAPTRPTTSTLATAWDVTKKLGKRGVLVEDAPAFVVNRLLTRQSSVLMQALENGNTFEETDEAALRLGHPDAALGAARDGRPEGREPRPPHAARRVPRPLPALADARELRERRDGRRRSRATTARAVDEIHDAILDALADECRHILDEGVVASAAEIDACLILGAGLPVLPRRPDAVPRPERASRERVTGGALGDA